MDAVVVAERIAGNVQIDILSGCWVWTGATDRDGYALTTVDGKRRLAHRVSYELAKGPIPHRAVVDHLVEGRAIAPGPCRYRCCVNPDHLEAVSVAENSRRVRSWNAAKMTCPKGHAYDGDNVRYELRKDGGVRRHCRECDRAADRARRAKKPAA